jgi:hypothetical protein
VRPFRESLMPFLAASENVLPASVATATATIQSRVRGWMIGTIDAVILVYLVSLAVLVLTGGVNTGWLRIEHPTKPILTLLLFVPVRIALGGQSSLLRPVRSLLDAARRLLIFGSARVGPAVRDAFFAFAATVPPMVAVSFFVNVLFSSARPQGFTLPFKYAKVAETFAAWDSWWYFDIARRGYYFLSDQQSSVPFFPLYPLAMRVLAWAFGGSEQALWVSGIAISCVSFFAGLVVLHRLTERICNDRETARRTILYLAVYPFSFFLTRVYPSGLFFLLTVLAVDAANSSRWWRAGLWGALATLTRPHGILIAVPLVLMAMRGGGARHFAPRLVALAPIPAALVGFSAYIASLTGDPLAWLHSERAWGYSLWQAPWQQLLVLFGDIEQRGFYMYFFSSPLAPFRLFHGAIAIFLLILIPTIFRRLGVALGAYVLVNLLVPLSSNALEGIGRYAAAWFPVFIVMGMVQSPRVREAILVTSSLLLALFVGLFVTWQPIY